MADSVFEKDYFKNSSTYKKFSDTNCAVRRLSNYYFGLYRLIYKYYTKPGNLPINILEIGCGYSGLVNHFVSDGCNYTGLDISRFIVDELGRRYPGITFLNHDIQLPIPVNSKFDLVVGMEVLEHIPNPLAALRNLALVLVDGGTFIASVPNPDSRIPFTNWRDDPTHVSVLTEKDWLSLFNQAGLKRTQATTIFTLPYIWRFSKIFSKFYCVKGFGASILLVGHK